MSAETWALVPIGLAVAGKLAEGWRHRRTLTRIPIRVHVNGTRGKSQTTRLITWGLQAGGIRTMGKITGDRPLLIEPDGSEVEISRRGPVSIAEQRWTVRQASKRSASALVIECMAIHPELQRASEERIVRSTIGVITNVRTDHVDVLGESPAEAAAALASTTPRSGVLFTAERGQRPVLERAARKRGSRLVSVHAAESAEDDALQPLHADNLALALAVCEYAGVERRVALSGILARMRPETDREAWLEWPVEDRRITLVNAFSANDPVSTRMRLRLERQRHGGDRPWVGIFCHRRDRNFRFRLFAEFVEDAGFDRLLLIGERVSLFARRGLDALDLSGVRAEHLPERILQSVPRDAVLFGFGNIGGAGRDLIESIQGGL